MEKLKILKKKVKTGEGEWTSSFAGESKMNTELRKLTNSAGWVAATRKVLPSTKSPASSRASTPSNASNSSKNSKKGRKKKGDNAPTKKKFKMVLEKDEDFEVDYVSPEEEENTEESDSESKGINSDNSGDDFSMTGEEDPDDDLSSIENGSIHLDDDFPDPEMDVDFPPLQLPESSRDLLISNNLVLPVLGIYEILRHFRSLLRLSPMLFEDFCAALVDEETNILLTECYISVVKAILREEDAAGVQFGPQDQKDSRDAALSFLDHMTWPEIVRAYLEGTGEHNEVLSVCKDPKFPRVNVEGKVAVLKTLTDIYLASNKIRDQLMTDGVIHYDDHCRVCHKLGDLLCCETCSAVYHLACCDPPLNEVPDDEWQCEICVAHKLNGVYNCEPQQEFKGQYLRHEPIGTDRHGNKYWFLARRLIVEGPDQIWYYSTHEQCEVLMSLLDSTRYEMVLCEALKDVAEEFPKHAKITEDLTEEALPEDNATMYLTALKARVKKEQDEKRQKIEEEERKKKEEEELKRKEEDEKKQKEIKEKQQKQETAEQTKAAETAPQRNDTGQQKPPDITKETPQETIKNALDVAPKPNIITDQTAPSTPSSTPLTAGSQPLTPAPVLKTVTPVNNVAAAAKTPVTVVQSGTVTPVVKKIVPNQGKPIQVIKLGSNLPLKPVQQPTGQPGTTTTQPVKQSGLQLKTLFVLNKDGTKTQITLGPTGKLTTATSQGPGNRQIVVLNSATVPLPKVNRELKKLQFTGAGPKTADVLNNRQPPVTQQGPTQPKEAPLPPPPIIPQKKLTHAEEAELYFRLGEDKAYCQYINHYTDNTLALNKYQHKEERDRERYLSYKFSLSGEGEFKWIGNILGPETSMLETLRSTLMHLEHQIPLCFMHTKWDRYRNAWGKMVMTCNSPQGFAAALGILEMATRVVVKRSVWRNSHGLPRLKRVTVSEKEEWDKKRKHRTRADEEESNRNAVWCKYPFPIKSTMVWKVRGEEYRMTGYGGWTWISTTRQSKFRPYRPKPFIVLHEDNKGTPAVAESKPTSTTDSQPSEKKELSAADADSDSEKSSSTTSTTTTKSADLTEDQGIFDALVQEATITGSIVTSSSASVTSSSASVTSSSASVTSSTTNDAVVMSPPSSTSKTAVVTSQVKSEPTVTSPSVEDRCDDIINANDVINISENLLKRTLIYKKKWSASRVDILLGWRMVQKDKERSSGTNTNTIPTKPTTGESKAITMTTDVKKPTDVTMATSVADSKVVTGRDATKSIPETKPATMPTMAPLATISKPIVVSPSTSTSIGSGITSDVTNTVAMETNSITPKATQITSSTASIPTVSEVTESEVTKSVTMETEPPNSSDAAADSKNLETKSIIAATNASTSTVSDITTSGSDVINKVTMETSTGADSTQASVTLETKPIAVARTANDVTTTGSDVINMVAIETPPNSHKDSDSIETTEATTQAAAIVSETMDGKNASNTLPGHDTTNNLVKTEPEVGTTDKPSVPNEVNQASGENMDDKSGIKMLMNETVTCDSATGGDRANTTHTIKVEATESSNAAFGTVTIAKGKTVSTAGASIPEIREIPEIAEVVQNGVDTADEPMVDVTTTTPSDATTSTVTTEDSTNIVDSIVETSKTTIADGDQTVTIVETHATTITKTTTVTKTVTSSVAEEPVVTKTSQEPTKDSVSVTANDSSDRTVAPNVTTESSVMANKTNGIKLVSQPVNNQPELVISLPKIEIGKSGKASVVTHQIQRARLSRMSRARRVVRQARNGPLVATQKVWKLQRYRKKSVTSKKEMKLPLPWKFCIAKQKKKSIFRLPASVIRKVAVRGGQYAYRAGFTFGAKWFSGLEQYWFYPCPRPTFSLTWRYKLQNVTTFASFAHLLRVFWHALKWDKMTMRPQTDDVVHTVTTDDEIITTELLKRKDNLRTGLHSDYYIRRIRMPILDPEEEALRAIKPAEGYTPSRKGLRSSRRSSNLRDQTKRDSEPQVQSIWVPEEQVELWQIRQFDIMLKQQQQNVTQPKVTSQSTSVFQSGSNTFIATPSGGVLPTIQNLKSSKIESEIAGPGFSIVRLPLHQNAQLLQKSLSPHTPQSFLSTKTMLGTRSPVQKIIIQPQTQFAPYKQGGGVDKQQAVIRSTPAGTQYIVQGGKLMKPIIIKAGSPIVTTPIQSKSAIRPHDQAIKFQQQPPLLPTMKKSPASITPRTPPQQQQQQTQIKLSTGQLQQLLRVGSATPIRVSVTLGNGRLGVGQVQLIPPGSQVTPSAGQQLMQTRVGGVIKRFLFTLISENVPKPTTPPSPANEVSLQTASLSQRLQQIQRQQLLGKNRNTDMKRLMTDKDPLWGSKPQVPERSPFTPNDADRPKKKPLSKIQREEGQRQTVVAQLMKSILDRIEHKEKIELRNRKREEAIMKQKERKEQSEQAKVHNRQTQFLHKHRDHLKQEILKRRAIVEKYLTHAVKNELREDQRKHRRGGSSSDVMSPPVTKRPKKTYGNAIITSAVLSENNAKRAVSGKQAATKRRRTTSPPPDAKKQKMISTKKKDTKLYCICKTHYDSTKFYIGCDLCLNWFHGTCVGIPEEKAQFMNEWICGECKRAKEEPAQELYCLCRTPYDDSRFYIGCDICQDWYHGECVGIAEKDADKIDFYTCPRCKNKKRGPSAAMEENLLTRSDHVELTKVIRSLRAHKMAWPFLQPVSKFEVPHYHKIIKKPMDLGTVMNKLPTYTMLSEIMSDVSLIFDNCRMFNGAESALTRCAEIVESVFVGKMREYRARRKSLG